MPKASFFQKRVLDAVRPVPRYLGESRMSLGRGRHLQYLVYACPAHVDETVLFENTPDFPNYFYTWMNVADEEANKECGIVTGLVTGMEAYEGTLVPSIRTRWNVMAVDRNNPTLPLGAMIFESTYSYCPEEGAYWIWVHIHAAGVDPAFRGKGIGTVIAELAGQLFADCALDFNGAISSTSLSKFGALKKATFYADFISEGGESVCDMFVDIASIIEDDGVEILYDAGF